MKKKKIIGFVAGIFAYVFMFLLFSGYMHLKSHPFLNTMMVDEFVNKATNKSFVKDAEKFKNYEFNLNNSKAPKLVGPALNTGEYYLSYSEADEYNAVFTPAEWIKEGGWMEDEPWGPASLCHFYDPLAIDGGKKNLTDRGTYVETFLTPLIIYKSRDARYWASLSSNRYNWQQAKESVVKALQQATPSERNKYMAIAYRSLGETLHLIADMGCPPHVRNDSHPPKAQIVGVNVFGDPDPYEDIAGTIDLTKFTGPSYQPNSSFKSEVGNTNVFETIFDKMALFTNGRIPTNQTIVTSKFKQIIRPDNPYQLPSISEAEYRSDKWAYVKNYDGKDIIMCKDKHPYTLLSGNYRGQPYIDKECVESQASLVVPNIVEAGANVLRLFIPALKVTVTDAKADSGGIVRGNIKYTIPSADDEYSGLFDLNNIYTGPVSIFVNGTKLSTQFDAANGTFEAKNITSLKKDDLVKAQIEFGGIILNSDPAVASAGTVTPKFTFLNIEFLLESINNWTAKGKYHPKDPWGWELPILRDTLYSGTDSTVFGFSVFSLPITMSGNAFTASRQETVDDGIAIWSISGSYDPVAKTASISCDYSDSKTLFSNTYSLQQNSSCSANGVPILTQSPTTYSFEAKGLAACNYASGVKFKDAFLPIPPLGVTESGIGITKNLSSFFCSTRTKVLISLMAY